MWSETVTFRVGTVLVFLSFTGLCSAGLSPAQLFDLDWTKARFRAADEFQIPQNSFIRWRETVYPNGDTEDLDRLRSIVGEKPDHPLRRELETLERQLTVSPDGRDRSLWYIDSRRFRLSSTFAEGMAVAYNDTVADGNQVWRLTDRSLHLFTMNDLPDGEGPLTWIGPLRSYLVLLLYNSFSSGPANIQPVSVTQDGTSWVCLAEFADGSRRFLRRGEIQTDSLNGRNVLRVSESEVIASDDPQWIGSSTHYSDWRPNTYVNREIPHRIEKRNPDGTSRFVVELLEFRPLDPGELEPLMSSPDADSEDPIRGRVTYTSIHDSRSGATRLTGAQADLSRDTGTRGNDGENAWRYLVIGGVIFVFLFLAVRIRMMTKQ